MVNNKKIASRIITFYSYKGGVGRSMGMVNVGVVMSMWGYKVLLIDWDLEAPGLENYFCHHIDVKSSKENNGLIDLLDLKNKCDEILVEELPWNEYIQTIQGNTFSVDMISAGKRDENYFNKVRQFDYAGFYNESGGGDYIENLREYWLDHYDFVLIDSRTGLTDSSGICSIHMPDILVVMFTPNEQSFNGVKEVAQKAVAGQKQVIYDRFRLRVLPIPCRIENAETQLLDEWMTRIYKESEPMLEWLPKSETNPAEFAVWPADVIGQIRIPYKAYYSYGERLAVVERGTSDPLDLGFVYESIAAVLVNDLQQIHLLKEARDLLIKKARGEDIVDYSELEKKFADEQDLKFRLQEELKKKESFIEEKQLQSKKRKTNLIWIAAASAIAIAAIFYAAGTFNKKPIVNQNNPVVKAPDSLENPKIDLAIDFATTYSTSNLQTDLGFNMQMAEKYVELSPAYQDSFKDIKEKIEFAISYRFQELADSFYTSMRTKPPTTAGLLSDSIQTFGNIKNPSAKIILSRLSNKKQITNQPVDSSFDLQIVPKGFLVTYRVNGNSLPDINRNFKRVVTNDAINYNKHFKITDYSYAVIDSIAEKVVLEKINVALLICNGISKNEYAKISGLPRLLKGNSNLSIITKMNFTASSDKASPFYFNEAGIKYSDASVYKESLMLQEYIYKLTGSRLPLQLQRSGSKKYINAYYCATTFDKSNIMQKY